MKLKQALFDPIQVFKNGPRQAKLLLDLTRCPRSLLALEEAMEKAESREQLAKRPVFSNGRKIFRDGFPGAFGQLDQALFQDVEIAERRTQAIFIHESLESGQNGRVGRSRIVDQQIEKVDASIQFLPALFGPHLSQAHMTAIFGNRWQAMNVSAGIGVLAVHHGTGIAAGNLDGILDRRHAE